MGANTKLKSIGLDYNFKKDGYSVSFNLTNIDKIRSSFSNEYLGKLKGELFKVIDVLLPLDAQSLVIEEAEKEGLKIIELEKSDDFYVKSKLPTLGDRTFLKVKLSEQGKFKVLYTKVENKVNGYIDEIEDKMSRVRKVINITDVESEQVKLYANLNNEFIVLIDMIDRELKMEFNKLKTYIEVIQEFDFVEYETTFKGFWK
ncbi:MAG: hypothetical protein QM490_01915 [Candidatus Gracilibacteria bacterium]